MPGESVVVLVVEDEALIRMDAADRLTDAGYTVIQARNADDAIGILESRSDVKIVFTDVDMPGAMDGLKLARYVRGRWPPIKLVVTSGQVSLTDSDLPNGGRFLRKPYTTRHLTRTMAAVIAG